MAASLIERVEPPREQLARCLPRTDDPCHDAGVALIADANAEAQDDPFVAEAARREAQDVTGRRIEPLCVVDGAQHRRRFRSSPDDRHHARSDREAIGGPVLPHGESPLERPPLRRRDLRAQLQHWSQELSKTRIGEIALGLDARRTEHPEVACSPDRRIDERRLARAGRSLEHQRGGLARPRPSEQLGELPQLAFAPDERHTYARLTIDRHPRVASLSQG